MYLLTLAILLVLARFAAMVLCAAVLTVAISKLSDNVLPFATSFEQTFGRLGTSIQVGAAAGALLGGLLTHGLGRSVYGTDIRIGLALIAASPFIVLAGMFVFDR